MSEQLQTEQRETMDSNQVAEFLNLDIESVRRYARDGRLPAYRIPGTRKHVFYRDEIENSLKPSKVTVIE